MNSFLKLDIISIFQFLLWKVVLLEIKELNFVHVMANYAVTTSFRGISFSSPYIYQMHSMLFISKLSVFCCLLDE